MRKDITEQELTQDNSEDGLFNSIQNLPYKVLNLTIHSN